MSTNPQTQNERALEKVTTADFTGAGLLSPEQFDEFFREVQDQSQILGDVRQESVTAPSGELPKIGVGERLLQAANEGTAGTNQNVNTSQIPFQTTKLSLPWELTTESVRETIEGEGTARTIMEMFAAQFAVDLEDLAVNGDETGTGFVALNDGWLALAGSRGAPTYDHTDGAGTAQAVNKGLFSSMLQSLDAKYKRDNGLVFLMAQSQKEAFKEYLTDRSTGAGDNMLLTGDEPTPYGYEILCPVNFPEDQVLLTRPNNLMYMIQRDVEMRQATTGSEVTKRDLYAIYNMLAKIDFQIEDENAMVLGSGLAAP